MSKAILVLNDMPTSCVECPCEFDELYCQKSEHKLSYDELFDHRPDNCPLKEMLEKKTMAEFDPHIPKNIMGLLEYYIEGWNDCLEAIGGESDAD